MTTNLRVPPDFPDRTVCVMCLGLVGITLATSMAAAGFKVIGVETRPDVVDKLNRGDVHFFEPGLSAQVQRVVSTGDLSVFGQIPAGHPASVYIITVGTPLQANRK